MRASLATGGQPVGALVLELACCAAALVTLSLGACASSQAPGVSMAAPASPADGRQQLEALEAQIARDRIALGLPPRAPQRTTPDAARHDEDAAESSAGTASDAKVAQPILSPPAPAPPAEQPERVVASKRKAEGEEVDARCNERGPCRYTRAICRAAERICVIAAYLADADARQRCTRARQDCNEARQSTRASCPGC